MSTIPFAVLVGLVWQLAARGVAAGPCVPTAVVEGSSKIAESVRALLHDHGVALARGVCGERGEVRASLSVDPGAPLYRLHIEAPFGRTSDRRVGDAETAASLIESWAVPAAAADVAAPLAARAPADHPEMLTRQPPPATILSPVSRWYLMGALEVAGGSDQSLWYGVAATACARIGALCIGGRARFARDDSVVGPDRDVGRSATELLALASLPIAWGGLTVAPRVGLGAGWVHTGRPPEGEAETARSNDLGMRLEAAGSVGLAIAAHVSLIGEASASRGWSMAHRGDPGMSVNVPAGYLRAAVAFQYTP